MIVVSNSSPLITLSRVGQLDLLREFYARVLIAKEVYDEVAVAGFGLPGAAEIRHADWIETRQPPTRPSESLEALCQGLGAGERGTIYLARALRANLVLIDEAKARRIAKRAELTIAGSLAVLERAASAKKIPDLRSVYLKLIEQGIHFDPRLLDDSLGRLGLPKLRSST